MPKKHSYDYVFNYFKDNGCLLLDKEYKGNKIKMNYICNCREQSSISFGDFASGVRCKKCASKNNADRNRFSLKEVKDMFKKENCELLDEEYIGANSPLKYKCVCGNMSTKRLNDLRNGHVACDKCAYKKSSSLRRTPYEEVYEIFKHAGFKLLENKYINSSTKMKYICSCGRTSFISKSAVIMGHKCRQCGIEKCAASISAEKHYNWKGGKSSISSYLRGTINRWKSESLQNSDYNCAISKIHSDKLVIHHLYPFNKIVKDTLNIATLQMKKDVNQYTENELKILEKIFILEHDRHGLGVPLTKKLHAEFHNIYGKTDFTPENFEEFKLIKQASLQSQSAS